MDTLILKCSDTRFPDAPRHDLLDDPLTALPHDAPDDDSLSDAPPEAQPGKKVRLIRLQKKSELNGVEGVLGAKGFDTIWQFIFGTRSISVKADNFETVTRSKNTLHDEFMRASIQFEYHNEVVNSHVFDQVWKHANKDGGIEGLFDTILADEQQFDIIYQAFVQR